MIIFILLILYALLFVKLKYRDNFCIWWSKKKKKKSNHNFRFFST